MHLRSSPLLQPMSLSKRGKSVVSCHFLCIFCLTSGRQKSGSQKRAEKLALKVRACLHCSVDFYVCVVLIFKSFIILTPCSCRQDVRPKFTKSSNKKRKKSLKNASAKCIPGQQSSTCLHSFSAHLYSSSDIPVSKISTAPLEDAPPPRKRIKFHVSSASKKALSLSFDAALPGPSGGFELHGPGIAIIDPNNTKAMQPFVASGLSIYKA